MTVYEQEKYLFVYQQWISLFIFANSTKTIGQFVFIYLLGLLPFPELISSVIHHFNVSLLIYDNSYTQFVEVFIFANKKNILVRCLYFNLL